MTRVIDATPLFAPGSMSDPKRRRLSPEGCIRAMFEATDMTAHMLLLHGALCAEEDEGLTLLCEMWWLRQDLRELTADFRTMRRSLRRLARITRRRARASGGDPAGLFPPDMQKDCAVFERTLEPEASGGAAGGTAPTDIPGGFSRDLREGGHFTIAYNVFYHAYRLYSLYVARAPRRARRREACLLAQSLTLHWKAEKIEYLRRAA